MGCGYLIIIAMCCLSSEVDAVLKLPVPLWYGEGSYVWLVSTDLGRLAGGLAIVIKMSSWRGVSLSITGGPSPAC